MKNRHFLACAIAVMSALLVGCGSNDSQEEDYASYSQEVQDTSIAEDVDVTEDTTITIEDSTETEDTSLTEDTTEEDSESTSTDGDVDVTTTVADESQKDTSKTTTSEVTTTATTSTKTTTKATQAQNNSNNNSSNNNNSNNNNQSNNQQNNSNQSNNAQVEQPSQAEEPSSPTVETPSFSDSDIYVTINGYSFTVNANMDELLAYLGDAYTLESAPSCYYSGDDRTYIYNDFTIYTYSYDGATYYCQEVELTNDAISTSKGIKLGSSLADIENAYGNGYQVFGNEYRFYSGSNTYMYFFISNGTVDGLGYRIDIEE